MTRSCPWPKCHSAATLKDSSPSRQYWRCTQGHLSVTDHRGKVLQAELAQAQAEESGQTDALARSSDPDTSKDAAARVNVSKRERQVLDALKSLGDKATTREIADRSGVELLTVSPRLKPLEAKGLVRRTEARRDGAIVWAVV